MYVSNELRIGVEDDGTVKYRVGLCCKNLFYAAASLSIYC